MVPGAGTDSARRGEASAITRTLASRSKPALVAYLGLTALLVFGTSGTSTKVRVTVLAVALAISAARFAITRAILQAKVVPAWSRRVFFGVTLLAAAWWATFAFFIIGRAGPGDQLVVLMTTAGIASGAATSLAPEKALVRAYLALLLAPVVIALAQSGEPHGIPCAIAAAVFAVFLGIQATGLRAELVAGSDAAAIIAKRADELLAAQRAAEAASVAKSEFLANMSHELRTPMTAVTGYAELLLAPEVSTSDRLAHARTIRRNAEQLLTLLSDILDLSKIEAGKMSVERRICNPRSIIGDIEATMRPIAAARGLELRIRGVDMLPTRAETDRTRLRQILINLVNNAVKFTPAGSVTLAASSVTRREGVSLRFEITDTGIGITAEQAARLFTPFGQADSSTTRKFGGTGLGLSISRTFAQMLGGDITLASKMGVGSTFTVEIDAGDTADREFDDTALHRVVDGARGIRLDGMNILVADDSTDNQRLLRAFLEAGGAHVDVASNGREAVTMTLAAVERAAAYDLVFMDMQMPELDGLAAVAELRAASYKGRIAALTAHAMVGDRERYISGGCDDYVTKPVSRLTLLSAASAHFTPRASAVRTRSAAPPTGPSRRRSSPLVSELAADPALAPMVGSFVCALEGHIGDLAVALEQADAPRLRDIAHTLAGTGGTVGFPTISAAASELETSLRTGTTPSASAPLVAALIIECRRAIVGAKASGRAA